MAREKLVSGCTTAGAPGRVTIYHHQLRDLLVCPRERGIVNYISNNLIVSHDLRKPYLAPKLLAHLDFQPNCLTSGSGLIVAGGGMAELFIGALPTSTDASIPRHRSAKLPGPASINNSVLVTSNNLTPATPYGSSTPSAQPRLFVSNNDQTLKVFNVATADERPPHISPAGILKIPTPMNHASISPDGRTLLAVGDTNDVFLYNVSAGESVSFDRISTYKAGTDANFSTAWSSDGRKFATACQDGTVSVWDTRSSKALALFRCGPQTPPGGFHGTRRPTAGFGPIGRIRVGAMRGGFSPVPPPPAAPNPRRSHSREVVLTLLSEELPHTRLDEAQRQAVRDYYRSATDLDFPELPPVIARLVESSQRRRAERSRATQRAAGTAAGVEEDPYETPPSEGTQQVGGTRTRGIPRQYTWTTTVEGDVTVATRPSQSPTISMPTSNWAFLAGAGGGGATAATPESASPSPELTVPPPAVYNPPNDIVRHWPSHFPTNVTAAEPGRGEGSWMSSSSVSDPLPGAWAPDAQRNAARVLKFSPGTGSRDLLVWTEDSSQFHVVDAQTFHDHVVVAVPSHASLHVGPMSDVPETVASPSSDPTASPWTQTQPQTYQAALPTDVPHLTGLAFDPSGQWIYVGTTEGVYEWEAERGDWDRGYADFA